MEMHEGAAAAALQAGLWAVLTVGEAEAVEAAAAAPTAAGVRVAVEARGREAEAKEGVRMAEEASAA